VISPEQAVEIRYLQRVHRMALLNKVRKCEICEALNVEALGDPRLRDPRSTIVWPHDQNATGKIDKAAGYTHGKVAQWLPKDEVL